MTDDENKLPEKAEAENKDKSGEQPSRPIEPEVLEKLPPEVKKVVESFSLQAITAPVFNPILGKINETHIDKVLEQTEKDSERDFKDAQSTKKFSLCYVLIFAALFVFAIVFLVDRNPELLKEMIKYLAVFAGGYGFKSFMDRRGEE